MHWYIDLTGIRNDTDTLLSENFNGTSAGINQVCTAVTSPYTYTSGTNTLTRLVEGSEDSLSVQMRTSTGTTYNVVGGRPTHRLP